MFAVTGMTGQVGSVVARTLLGTGRGVRGILRNRNKSAAWEEMGCEIFLADMNNAAGLQQAFAGTEGVFAMLPPSFDPAPGFPEARQLIINLREALAAANPPKVVCLSTIGAQATQENLLTQLHIMEEELSRLAIPIAFLRAAWFMENFSWDLTPARNTGVMHSFLQPLDKLYPMVATADIGGRAAELLRETWQGRRVVELEGPRRFSPNQVGASLARMLNHDVRVEAVPRENWEKLFRSQGMKNPTPRMRMLDGFNQGWIEFEGGIADSEKGSTELEQVLRGLIA